MTQADCRLSLDGSAWLLASDLYTKIKVADD